jgi:hypothetical protein
MELFLIVHVHIQTFLNTDPKQFNKCWTGPYEPFMTPKGPSDLSEGVSQDVGSRSGVKAVEIQTKDYEMCRAAPSALLALTLSSAYKRFESALWTKKWSWGPGTWVEKLVSIKPAGAPSMLLEELSIDQSANGDQPRDVRISGLARFEFNSGPRRAVCNTFEEVKGQPKRSA